MVRCAQRPGGVDGSLLSTVHVYFSTRREISCSCFGLSGTIPGECSPCRVQYVVKRERADPPLACAGSLLPTTPFPNCTFSAVWPAQQSSAISCQQARANGGGGVGGLMTAVLKASLMHTHFSPALLCRAKLHASND
jgi:hypothetical protein